MIREEWRDVEGCVGYYQVSNRGNLRGINRKAYVHVNQSGYVQATLRRPGIPDKMMYMHRLVALTFLPNPAGLPEVHHIDGDKHNNRVENLQWIAMKDNRERPYGGHHRKPRVFTSAELNMIAELYKQTGSVLRVAEISGIGSKTLFRLIKEMKNDGLA